MHRGRRYSLAVFLLLLLGICSSTVSAVEEIDYWSYFGDEPAVRAFEQKYDVKVNYTQLSWTAFSTKTPVAIAAGSLPDVLRVSSGWFGSWEQVMATNAFAGLTPYMKAEGINPAYFVPGEIQEATYKGEIYGIPFAGWAGIPNSAVILNLNLFENAGLAKPAWDWTYDQMMGMAKKMTLDLNGDSKNDQWGGNIRPTWAYTYPYVITSYGGRFMSEDGKKAIINSPASARGLDFLFDFTTKYGYNGGDFFKKQSGMFVAWSQHAAANIRTVVDTGMNAVLHPMPVGPDGRQFARQAVGPFDPLMIAQTSKRKELAWKLIEFITMNPEGSKVLIDAKTDPIPLCPYRPNLQGYLRYLPEVLKTRWFSTMERMVNESLSQKPVKAPFWWDDPELNAIKTKAISDFFKGTIPAPSALEVIQTQMDKTVLKYK